MALNRRVEIIVRHINNKNLSTIDIKNDILLMDKLSRNPLKTAVHL